MFSRTLRCTEQSQFLSADCVEEEDLDGGCSREVVKELAVADAKIIGCHFDWGDEG